MDAGMSGFRFDPSQSARAKNAWSIQEVFDKVPELPVDGTHSMAKLDSVVVENKGITSLFFIKNCSRGNRKASTI
jgi:hypothetical protein